MKKSKLFLFLLVIVLITSIVFGCSKDSESLGKDNIEAFLNEKVKLYEKRDKIINIINSERDNTLPLGEEAAIKSDEDILNKELSHIRKLLTKREYERLIANRKLIELDILSGKYDKIEIKDIDYKKISEDKEKLVYQLEYKEKLYLEGELREERSNKGEFTIDKGKDKYLISYIKEI